VDNKKCSTVLKISRFLIDSSNHGYFKTIEVDNRKNKNLFRNKVKRRLITIFVNITLSILIKIILKYCYCLFDIIPRKDIVVSLTSFPQRVNNLYIVIYSILTQTYRPRTIYLYLSKEEFQCDEIPKTLVGMAKYGLKIVFVEKNYKSHKKYLYIFGKKNSYEDAVIIDDDLIYPSFMIEELYKFRNRNIQSVVCHRAYEIVNPSNYSSWKLTYEKKTFPENNIFFTTGGGTLLNRNSLFKDFNQIKRILLVCPNADDVWLNAMVRIKGESEIIFTGSKIAFIEVYNRNNYSLKNYNIDKNGNNIQIGNVTEYYNRNVFEKMI
jgi:hypothetical protein